MGLIDSLLPFPSPEIFAPQDENLEILLSLFSAKVQFSLDVGDYVIKTATKASELEQALHLRYKVFIEEGLGKNFSTPHDYDEYDLLADHILLIHKPTNQIIGTYRVISNTLSHKFYSQGEFHIDLFLNEPGVKLELGRACILKEFRKSSAIHLIWKGLGQYARMINAQYMFGCTSIKVESREEQRDFLHLLGPENHSDKYGIRPKDHFLAPEISALTGFENSGSIESQIIPPLLRSYLKAGAKVYGQPAYDADFRCSDFFTIIDFNKMPSAYIKKYLNQ